MLVTDPIESRDPNDRSFTLLTGATGLLGQYLMKDLLVAGNKLAVVVRKSRKQSAQQRIDGIFSRLEAHFQTELPRPVVLAGQIDSPQLGLNADDRAFVKQYCNRMIHNAAILQFEGADRSGEPWRTNVDGTGNVIELARRAQIEHMHYVSTAYVCGNRHDTIYEHQLDVGQSFRNDYEESKFLAEMAIRDCDDFLTTTVYRPVVISGDSKTGYTSTYHGLYVYLRLFAMFVPMQPRDSDGRIATPVTIPLEGNEPRNVVPVDWVSQTLCDLFANRAAHGNTYHLSPDVRLTPREVIEACYRYFNSYGVEFSRDHQAGAQPQFAEEVFRNVEIYSNYETSDPLFDKSNTRRFADTLPCPTIDEAMILRYLQFGEFDQWGKRRYPIPTSSLPAEQHGSVGTPG